MRKVTVTSIHHGRFWALCVVFLLTMAQYASAQFPQGGPPSGERGNMAGFSISGQVVEAEKGEPIASATVAVWRSADSTLATGAVTEPDGRFTIEGLRPGRYYVKISYIGFSTQTVSDVTPQGHGGKKDLGVIKMPVDTRMMADVEVTGERSFMEVNIDRTVYNVRQQLVSVGGTGLDVLRNIPSVEVDIDNNISLRGSANLAVLINGRPSPLSGDALTAFLQGLPSDAIERVEVIPNPSAKYEPDGMAGILNIVLHQTTDANLSGSLTANGDTRENYGISGNVNLQKGKIGLYAGYGLRSGKRNMEGWRYQEYRLTDPLSLVDQNDSDNHDMLSHNFNATLDYRLSKLNTLSFATILNKRSGDERGTTSNLSMDQNRIPVSRYDRNSSADDNSLGMDYRLSFRRIIETSKHELTAELRYDRDTDDETNLYEQYDYVDPLGTSGTLIERQTEEMDDLNESVSFQLDYMRPFGQTGRLEGGYKGSYDSIDSDFYSTLFSDEGSGFDEVIDQDNSFGYEQTIHAAYGILAGEFGRFGLQGGLRAEQASRDFSLTATGESFDKSYFSLFPSAFMTYKLAEGRSLKISYSKRINRPRTHGFFNQLNPLSNSEDPLFRRSGNPYLNPEYVHSFEAGYTQLVGNTSVTLTPYFRRTVDVIRMNERLDENGVTWLTFQNFDTSDSWGAEAVATLRIGRWLNGFLNLNGYRIVTDGSNVDTDLTSDAFGFSTRANASVSLPRGLDLQLTFFYRSPIDIEGGHQSAMSMADIALRQKLFNDKASLSLRMNDVFGTMGMHMWRDTRQFFNEMDRSFDSQRIGLTFTYNFGSATRPSQRRGRPDQNGEQMPDTEEMMQ